MNHPFINRNESNWIEAILKRTNFLYWIIEYEIEWKDKLFVNDAITDERHCFLRIFQPEKTGPLFPLKFKFEFHLCSLSFVFRLFGFGSSFSLIIVLVRWRHYFQTTNCRDIWFDPRVALATCKYWTSSLNFSFSFKKKTFAFYAYQWKLILVSVSFILFHFWFGSLHQMRKWNQLTNFRVTTHSFH